MSNPVAVIQTIEDSPLWLDRRLVLAYLDTTYRVFDPAFDIRIGRLPNGLEKWLEERQARSFVFITAWNPASRILAPEENKRRNQLLEQRLQNAASLILPGAGTGDSGDWPAEAGFFAPDLAPDTAVQLGRDFGQHAIVYWKKGGVAELWWLTLPLL